MAKIGEKETTYFVDEVLTAPRVDIRTIRRTKMLSILRITKRGTHPSGTRSGHSPKRSIRSRKVVLTVNWSTTNAQGLSPLKIVPAEIKEIF